MTHDTAQHLHSPDPPLRSPHLRTPKLDKWPAEHTAMLEALIRTNEFSFRDITRQINERFNSIYSRSAIIGRAGRMGLCKTRTAKPPCSPRTRSVRGTKLELRPSLRIVAGNGNSNHRRVIQTVVAELPALRVASVEPLNITLADIDSDQCHFIAGNDGLYCGHPVRAKSWLCPAHHALCYRPAEERRRG